MSEPCEWCGCKTVVKNCAVCGAPQCCPRYCKETTADMKAPMSAREFADTYQYVVIGYRMQGKHARYEARHLEATGAQAACQKVHAEGLEVVAAIRGTNMMSPVLCSVIHAPSAQPHVAAGEGWRERMKKAIENARDLSYVLGCVEERNESTSEMADAKADDVDFQVTIDALIAEVCEIDLPALVQAADWMKDRVDGLLWCGNADYEKYCEIIRAATSAEDKASQ